MPIMKAKDPSPLILNIGFINILKNLPNMWAILVLESNSVAMKNGKREGTTDVAHKIRPDLAAVRLYVENITKEIVKSKKIIGKICFFIKFSSSFPNVRVY